MDEKSLIQLAFVESLINDKKLSHLTLKDLKKIVVHLQNVSGVEEENDEEVDEKRYVI
jgi:hypothetical protein